jgi:prevent-host-death family protein
MDKTVTLAEAKAHISALVAEVEAGGEITITKHGKAVARLVSAPSKIVREPGDWCMPGEFDPSIFAPMTDAEMREEGWPV